MSQTSVAQERQNSKQQLTLTCTNCGNADVHVYLRSRHPHGYQAYATCLACGARNWVEDQDKDWASIRYMPVRELAAA